MRRRWMCYPRKFGSPHTERYMTGPVRTPRTRDETSQPEGVWTTLCSNGFVEGCNSSQLVMLPRRLRDRGQGRPDVLMASELGDHSRALSPGADVENHKGFGDMFSAVTAARRPR